MDGLEDDTAAAMTAAEGGAVAAGAAGAAAAVVGDVITAPHGWPAGIGQSCWALSTAIGIAGLLPRLLALAGNSPLGPLDPLGPLGHFSLNGLQDTGRP